MKTKLINNNLLLKILSVIAAVMLWVIVLNIDDPIADKTFKNVKVNMINTDTITSQNQVYRIEEGTDTVDLTVYARRRSVLSKLKVSDFVVTADMQKDLRYNSMVEIEIKYVGNYSIDHVEQSRTNVLVSIEESVTEQFKVSVKTTGEPSGGLVVGSALPEQTLVEITGPISTVEKIKRVEASVDISGITGTVVRKCKLKLMNSDGDEIDGTYLDYIGKDEEFEVTVTTLNTKLVGISFDVSQVAPAGYGLSSISYKPETVTIAGLKSVISPIYNLDIPASALNPDKNVGKIEQMVDISQYLPDGVTIPDADDCEVAVTMEIVEYETKTYEILPGNIFFANIQEGLALDASEMPAVEISVSAIPQQLESLNVQDIELTVNLEDCKKEGVYTVPVQATLPSGYQYTPFVISVNLVELEES